VEERKIVKTLPRLNWYKVSYVCDEINKKQKEPIKLGSIFGTQSNISDLEQVVLDDETKDFVIWHKLELLGVTVKGADKEAVGEWLESFKQT
jgi:hypothetical protein